MNKNCTYLLFAAAMFLAPVVIQAQQADTLAGVQVFSKAPLDITTSTIAVQQLDKVALLKLNSISVADAVKYFPGIVVKDYGGIGGLKTVSVRSLGANQTGVMYDGIMLGDAQGGQIDLGKLSLDNIEMIRIYYNHPSDLLIPARSYASASVLSLSTSSVKENEKAGTTAGIKFKAGSFGFINPSFLFKSRINDKFVHGLNAEYQYAKGNYTFTDYETGLVKKRRFNSDLNTWRLEYDAAYGLTDSNKITIKVYYYASKRGLPGSVVLFNPVSEERLNNNNFFTQFSLKRNISLRSRLLVSGKFSMDYKYYLDPSYPNSAGKLENEFHQKELYFSGAYSYQASPAFSFSYASDYFNNKLTRSDPFAQSFANPVRSTVLNNIAFNWKLERGEVNANLLHTYVTESVLKGPVAKDISEFTPAFSASFQPVKRIPLRIRASYKNIFRAPTFDDLYYTNYGNTLLRPEYANQYNMGMALKLPGGKWFTGIAFTLDGYYNRVTDKILAVPRQNLFQWSMQNIGKVGIKGADASMHANFRKIGSVELSSNLSYTFQQAIDIFNPASALYKTQLPYTPKHSGGANMNAGYRNLNFSYNIISTSERYRQGDPVPGNRLPGWSTHDITISYLLEAKKYWRYKIIAEFNNIFNLQYEVIKYFPMPGFNFRLGVNATIKK